jgi:hypothetical protein
VFAPGKERDGEDDHHAGGRQAEHGLALPPFELLTDVAGKGLELVFFQMVTLGSFHENYLLSPISAPVSSSTLDAAR